MTILSARIVAIASLPAARKGFVMAFDCGEKRGENNLQV
jgi:hypothetical protein